MASQNSYISDVTMIITQYATLPLSVENQYFALKFLDIVIKKYKDPHIAVRIIVDWISERMDVLLDYRRDDLISLAETIHKYYASNNEDLKKRIDELNKLSLAN